MRLRVLDYAANPGGGVRFGAETIRALRSAPGVDVVEVVSHGAGLERYRKALGLDVRLLDIPPANARATRLRYYAGAPLVAPLGRSLELGFCFHYDVPDRALEGCDVLWLPWLHSHRPPGRGADKVVGSLHDVILIEYPQHFGRYLARDEEETIRRWLSSGSRMVLSSEATAGTLHRMFGADRQRFDVVPLSGQHRARATTARLPAAWDFADGAFLLCPANISPHKNHERLFEGFAQWGKRHPLVLTGPGTDLRSLVGRAPRLRRRLRALGLELGRDVVGLGYLDDELYYALLRRAHALVMPTLAEGGGSFPVWEALFEGVPVVSSNIPVMREMIERVDGEVLWFDPRRSEDLAARLTELEDHHARLKRLAVDQVRLIRQRTWDDVGADYFTIFSRAHGDALEAGSRSA